MVVLVLKINSVAQNPEKFNNKYSLYLINPLIFINPQMPLLCFSSFS